MVIQKPFLRTFISVASLVLLFDQVTKYFIAKYPLDWQWQLFSIHLSTNTGAGFGILQGQTQWLGIISVAIALLVIAYYPQIPKQKSIQIWGALFLGGVIGNMIDRIMRGYVIDFIKIGWWPSFNMADASISIAAIGMIIYFWKK